MARYGLRGGIATTLPVLLAVGVTLAVFGYARVPLNLFNWLALMLVLGVGANYAVFLREGCLRADADLGAVWTGVLLSAATTLLSFGMLAHERDARAEELRRDARARHRGLGAARADRHAIGIEGGAA